LSCHLYFAVTEEPEGPWEIKDIGEVPKFLGHKLNTRYCLYMHDQGSDLSQGELLIGWSNDGQIGGLVVIGKLRIGMAKSGSSTLG
jgi:hypothetical protein